jgi:hypothetical protein
MKCNKKKRKIKGFQETKTNYNFKRKRIRNEEKIYFFYDYFERSWFCACVRAKEQKVFLRLFFKCVTF